jgi:uncharacterized membrane protein
MLFMEVFPSIQRLWSPGVAPRWRGWPGVFVGIWGVLAAVFVLLPWSIEGKSLALLHGLCAQQPDHSFYFGDGRLPFDARMTGIYGGFACTVGYLLARGRWRRAAIPSVPVLAALASFVLLMGVDGVNSTLQDMRLPYAYEPQNVLRLVTGGLTGVALAIFIWLMTGQVGFARAARRDGAPVRGLIDLGLVLLVFGTYAAIVLSGWEPLRVPLTFLLMASALLTLMGLMLAFVLLLSRRESLARRTSDLAGPATAALLLALVVIGLLSGGRFLLEWWLEIPPAVRSTL